MFPVEHELFERCQYVYETVQTSYEAGLRRHHALDDAQANMLGWKASEES